MPRIELVLSLIDDGDLHQGALQVWSDPNVDGEVRVIGDPMLERSYSGLGEECETTAATVVVRVFVGTTLAYNTPYEFGARFLDAAGQASNLVVESGVMPKLDGSDGVAR